MTDKRSLADAIARAIADQIESSRSIIVQNMADVIHDALLLDGAKRCGDPVREDLEIATKRNWGSLKNWWQDEVDDYEKRRGGQPWAI